MENFIFDLQRFADAVTFNITTATIDGPSSDGTTFYALGAASATITEISTSTTDYKKETGYYLGITLKGSTYSYGVYECTEDGKTPTAVASTVATIGTVGTLNFKSGISSAEFGSGIAALITAGTTANATTQTGGSIEISTAGKYQSASGVESTIQIKATGITLTAGSLVFDKNTAAGVNVGTKTVSAAGGLSGTQTFTVSSDSVVSDATAGTTFAIDSDATSAVKGEVTTYTATANGAILTATTDDETPVVTTYLMKSSSSLNNLKIDFSGSKNELDGDYVTKNTGVNLGSISTNTTTTAVTLQGSAEGSTYVYEKGGAFTEYGYQDTSFGKFLGTIAYNDNEGVYSYDASGSSVGQKLDDATAHFASITGSAGKDTISSAATYINGGDSADTITASAASATVLGGAGKDEITFTTGKEAYIDGGTDADKITISGAEQTALYATVLGGDGDDTITSYDATSTVTGGAGADVFVIDTAKTDVNIADYNVSEDFIRVSGTAVTTTANTGVVLTTGGVITETGKGSATVTGSDFYVVNLQDGNKKTQVLAWSGENGANLDASSFTQGIVLKGNVNGEGDTLIGGSGKDTIYAGNSDSVMGGAGNDQIVLTGTNAGHMVAITSNSGKDTVSGYASGFEDKDSLFLVDVDPTAAAFSVDSSKNVIVKAGESSTTISGAAADSKTNAYELLVNDKKVAVAASNTTIKASSENYADIYFGTKSSGVQSGLSFSGVDENVVVDLSDTSKYHNINFVEGGAADSTLMGSSAKETLKAAASSGNTSLYGGAGADVLIGGGTADNFFFGTGAGKDTVVGFVDGTTDSSDRVTLLDGINFSLDQVSRSNANTIKLNLNTSDALTVSLQGGKVDNKFQLTAGGNNIVAKMGITGSANTFTFDSEVNYYVGSTKADTLTVADSDNHEVWLDKTNYQSIDVINAQNSTGNLILAGDDAANTIRGGKGDSSIWGGAGSVNDSLVGGTGADMFFWGAGEGNDTVTGTSDDNVNLYTLKLDQLTDWGYTSNSLYLTFGEQKLTVNGQVNDYTLEGKTWTLNRSTGEWSAKE